MIWKKKLSVGGIDKPKEYMEEMLLFLDKLLDAAFKMPILEEKLPAAVSGALWHMADQIAKWEKKGEFLPFLAVCEGFHLTSLERLALLLGAAPLYHRKYERIYCSLQYHGNQHLPTRGLCLSLARLMKEVSAEEEAVFLSETGNIELLLSFKENKGLEGAYQLRSGVSSFLLGHMCMEGNLRGHAEYFAWADELSPMVIRREKLQELCRLFDSAIKSDEKKNCVIMLQGSVGIGKHFLLKHMAAQKQIRLLFVDLSGILYERWETAKKVIEAAYVESVLETAFLCLSNCDPDPFDKNTIERHDCRKELFAYLEEITRCFFVLTKDGREQFLDLKKDKVCLELPDLTAEERSLLFGAYGQEYLFQEDVDHNINGSKYDLTPKGIQNVLTTARLLAVKAGREKIGNADICQAVIQNQNACKGVRGISVNSGFTWDDLILGEKQKKQLQMVCDHMKYRDIVEEKWGFDRKTSGNNGVSVLLYGPPGTGKTMVAGVLAKELGLPVYRTDLSFLMSNCDSFFRKMEKINALLFIDEADALFKAASKNDFLLLKLEEYKGITVLAADHINHIDDIYKRRIHFVIHIAFPDVRARIKLWKSIIPDKMCCDEVLNLDFFAERFELSGSDIREAVENAAYMAAAHQRGLTNHDLVEAVRLNYAKYGKILSDVDFGYLV